MTALFSLNQYSGTYSPTPPTPLHDAAEGLRRKEVGVELAASAKLSLLNDVRRVARIIASINGVVTMDDVGHWYADRGRNISQELGPAAGGVFRGKDWHFTGRRVCSTLASNHSREIKVWRLA